MTLDVSLEAIESDLRIAERGGQVGDLAMARAQVRATLLAAGGPPPRVILGESGTEAEPTWMVPTDHQGRHEAPETPTGNYITWHDSADIRIEEHPVGVVYLVPSSAAWDDRVTAAAMLLGIPHADLASVLERLGDMPTEPDLEPPVVPDEDELAAPAEIDADFFAEAKRARRKK